MNRLFVELLGKQERTVPGSYKVEFDPIVYGGFGFVRSHLEGEFSLMPGIYDDVGGINDDVIGFDEVFISIPFPWWTRKIIEQTKKYPGIKFVLMGNGVAMMSRFWSVPENVTIHRGWPEEFFGIKEFRQGSVDVFLPSYINNGREMAVLVPIDYACYWKKCTFCEQMVSAPRFDRQGRGDLVSILESIPEGTPRGMHVELSSPAMNPKRVNDLCRFMDRKIHGSYGGLVRADPGVVSAFAKYKDLSGLSIATGAESFSQKLSDSLNKGTKVENVIELVNVLLDRGAGVELFLLSEIPGMTQEHVEEERKAIQSMNCRSDRLEWSVLDLRWDNKPDVVGSFSFVPPSYSTGSGYYQIDSNRRAERLYKQRRDMFRDAFGGPEYMEKVKYQYAWSRGTPY